MRLPVHEDLADRDPVAKRKNNETSGIISKHCMSCHNQIHQSGMIINHQFISYVLDACKYPADLMYNEEPLSGSKMVLSSCVHMCQKEQGSSLGTR